MKKRYEITNKEKFALMNMKDRANEILSWVNENGKENIDWKSCFCALRWNPPKNDFNDFPESVTTEQEYYDLDDKICKAYENKAPLIRRKCRDCSAPFYIFMSERDYYFSQKLALPKRCKNCREHNKMKESVSA